jgi:hypothetical protein
MFKWYDYSAVCYVYLADLRAESDAQEEIVDCRCFSRVWTLQEYLASGKLEFYDVNWTPIYWLFRIQAIFMCGIKGLTVFA